VNLFILQNTVCVSDHTSVYVVKKMCIYKNWSHKYWHGSTDTFCEHAKNLGWFSFSHEANTAVSVSFLYVLYF